MVCFLIMKYLTLDGHFGVIYYYHFPLLNYFHFHDFISIFFFLPSRFRMFCYGSLRMKDSRQELCHSLLRLKSYACLIFTLHSFVLSITLSRVFLLILIFISTHVMVFLPILLLHHPMWLPLLTLAIKQEHYPCLVWL